MPTDGAPASERTELRLLYDEEALYVGAWLYDSEPEAIVAGVNVLLHTLLKLDER